MQEEMTQKTIALVFRATSFTARHFEAVIREAKHDMERHDTAVQNRRNAARQQRAQQRAQRRSNRNPAPQRTRHRQMSVGDLMGQDEKVSTIQIPDDLRSFQRIARRYNVDFAVKRDRSVHPPKYIIFFKAKDTEVLKECFKDYLNHQQRRREHPTFRQSLEKLKERAQKLHRVLEKNRNRGERSL